MECEAVGLTCEFCVVCECVECTVGFSIQGSLHVSAVKLYCMCWISELETCICVLGVGAYMCGCICTICCKCL